MFLENTFFPGATAKPESHLFFRRVRPLLERHMEKAERENSFIYHQKVPDICPEPEGKPTFGLVEAEPFVIPNMSSVTNSYNLVSPDFIIQ